MRTASSVLLLLFIACASASAQRYAIEHVRDAGQVVRFADAHTGFTFGNNRILRTTDGGASWQALMSDMFGDLGYLDVFDASFADASNGWIITAKLNLDSTLVYRTTDGGHSWHRQLASPVSGIPWASHWFTRLFFTDADHGWVVGKGIIMHTTDGGTTWSTQLKWPEKQDNNDYLRAIHFINRNEGWVGGYGGLILHTTNGGADWQIQREDTTAVNGVIQRVDYYYIADVRFADSRIGFAAANNGNFLYTDNGGATWQERNTGSLHNNESIGIGADGGVVMGGGGYCDDKGCYLGQSLLTSTDGGTTWTPMIEVLSTRPEQSLFNRIDFPTPGTGFASTSRGHLFRIRDLLNVSSVDAGGSGNSERSWLSAVPNPAHDLLSVTIAEPSGSGSLVLYDLLGRRVVAQSFTGAGRIALSLKGIAPGTYILEATTSLGVERERVVVR